MIYFYYEILLLLPIVKPLKLLGTHVFSVWSYTLFKMCFLVYKNCHL